jgi:hypothetical protein
MKMKKQTTILAHKKYQIDRILPLTTYQERKEKNEKRRDELQYNVSREN